MLIRGENMPITFGSHWFDWFVVGIIALLYIFTLITTGVIKWIIALSELFILIYFVLNYVIVDEWWDRIKP